MSYLPIFFKFSASVILFFEKNSLFPTRAKKFTFEQNNLLCKKREKKKLLVARKNPSPPPPNIEWSVPNQTTDHIELNCKYESK